MTRRAIRSLMLGAAIMASTMALAATAPAHAAKMMFGNQEYLEKIQDVDIKGSKGEALYLGYKYTHHAFVAPYYLSDDGYILGVVGQKSYYKLEAREIERLQASGLLPKPLPPYSIGIVDYAFGYLLWIILAGIGIATFFSMRKDKKVAAALPVAQEGLKLEQAGDFQGAIAKYGAALDIAPKHAEILCRRAACHRQAGDIDSAIADYSKAIAAEPGNVGAMMSRGSAFEAKQLMPQAIADYTRAVKTSKAAIAYLVRGDALGRSGDAAAAIKDFTAAIKKQPDMAAAYDLRAQAYEATGDQAKAAADRAKHAELAAAQAAAPAA